MAGSEGRKKGRDRFDARKLQCEMIRRRYNVEGKHRFEALRDMEDPEEEHGTILEK